MTRIIKLNYGFAKYSQKYRYIFITRVIKLGYVSARELAKLPQKKQEQAY